MDIDRQKVFLDASQTLNFSETAQRLHISQPTVSKRIQELEHDLGVTLFERESSRLKLSPAGQSLMPWAQQLIRECQKFQDIAHSLNECVAGNLTVACALLPALRNYSGVSSMTLKTPIYFPAT